jgi:hypothetical protein
MGNFIFVLVEQKQSYFFKKSYFSFFQFNLTHYIKHLSFGEDYPGIVNPLDNVNHIADNSKYKYLT